MERILAAFRRADKPLYLVGAAARNFLRTQDWGTPGVFEFISPISRKEIFQLQDLPVRYKTQRGPIPVNVELGEHTLLGYITCSSRKKSNAQALERMLKKRGYTIEALAIDGSGQVFDPFGVQKDLELQKIQLFQKEPVRAFEEDALKLIGLARLVAELGVQPERALLRSATEEAGRVLFAPRDGWFREMTMLLCGPHVWEGMQVLFDTRVLGLLLPEAHAMVGFAETSRYHHKDLWDHTRQVIDQAIPTPLVRWAALLHDVGKCWTRTYGKRKEVHFYMHDELGAILVEGIATRFRMEPSFQDALAFLVRNHLRPNSYVPEWTDSAVRRLITESGDRLQPLLQLSRADMTSGNEQKRQLAAQRANELARRVEAIQKKDARRTFLPTGLGRDIIETLALEPGPRVQRIKRFLEESIEAGELEAWKDIEYYMEFLRKQTSLPE
ncbi:MAG TPA: hypothetical protein DCE42_22185 [Myxococcales bacterium]|nr:hypothetical protein [Deltaproteobacteria bacterium]HAA57491.1 hypothetical protein [Myxococcales bacterium]|tara:strand:- start:6346 stop:7671 length:1326 start_codon:yes stop_codon:yes gene_type:complete